MTILFIEILFDSSSSSNCLIVPLSLSIYLSIYLFLSTSLLLSLILCRRPLPSTKQPSSDWLQRHNANRNDFHPHHPTTFDFNLPASQPGRTTPPQTRPSPLLLLLCPSSARRQHQNPQTYDAVHPFTDCLAGLHARSPCAHHANISI